MWDGEIDGKPITQLELNTEVIVKIYGEANEGMDYDEFLRTYKTTESLTNETSEKDKTSAVDETDEEDKSNVEMYQNGVGDTMEITKTADRKKIIYQKNYRKKIAAMGLSLAMAGSLCACGGSSSKSSSKQQTLSQILAPKGNLTIWYIRLMTSRWLRIRR